MSQLKQYFSLMRLDKPIGIFLLLWPTLWALWLAGDGKPNGVIVCIFIAGVIIMRSAGCIINDIADRDFDRNVERTRERPVTSGKMSVTAAFILFAILLLSALLLVLVLNRLTLLLALVGAILAIFYPFMKRFTHLPQLGLGLAFSWGVPMSFAAITNSVPANAWILYFAAMLWPVIYDTMYAMVDREDDIKIGVKSTAIAFGNADRWIIAVLQLLFIVLLIGCGYRFHLKGSYYFSLLLASGFFVYQQILIKDRDRKHCFQAFLNNHWVGMVVFVGIVMSYKL